MALANLCGITVRKTLVLQIAEDEDFVLIEVLIS